MKLSAQGPEIYRIGRKNSECDWREETLTFDFLIKLQVNPCFKVCFTLGKLGDKRIHDNWVQTTPSAAYMAQDLRYAPRGAILK